MGWFDFVRRRPKRRVGDPVVTPEVRRQIIGLDAADDMSLAEIAEELELSESTVRRVLKGKGRTDDPQRHVKAMIADAQASALRSNPELQQRVAEAAIDQLVGASKDKPLTQAQLLEAKQFFESQNLTLMHRSEIDSMHRRERNLESRLDRAQDRIALLSERLSRSGDSDSGLLGRLGIGAETQRTVLEGVLTHLVPKAASPPSAAAERTFTPALPAPETASAVAGIAQWLSAYSAFEPQEAARLMIERASGGAIVDDVSLWDVLVLLAAAGPDQVRTAVATLQNGEAVAAAVESRDPQWLQTFVTALTTSAQPAAAVALPSPPAEPTGREPLARGGRRKHGGQPTEPTPAVPATQPTPNDVLAQLQVLSAAEFVAWAAHWPELRAQLDELRRMLAELSDEAITARLQLAARVGPSDWRPAAAWLVDNPPVAQSLLNELRSPAAIGPVAGASRNGTGGF